MSQPTDYIPQKYMTAAGTKEALMQYILEAIGAPTNNVVSVSLMPTSVRVGYESHHPWHDRKPKVDYRWFNYPL